VANKPRSFKLKGAPTAAQNEREYDRTRYRNQAGRDLYSSARWKAERTDFLAQPQNQFCVRCQAVGILNAGHLTKDGQPQTNPRRMYLVVHHSQRHYGDPAVFWDRSKWQAVCPDHHDSDIQAEQSAEAKRLIERMQGGGSKV
jgi:5-methylcytosine-specific restriction protein A